MLRTISLAAILFLFWLALSGHYSTFLISIGAIASLACVWIGARIKQSFDSFLVTTSRGDCQWR